MKLSTVVSAALSRIFSATKSSQQAQQSPQIDASVPFPSLDLAFDLVRERLSYQSERVNTLDTKASFVLGSSTLLVGAAILTKSQIPSCHFLFFTGIFVLNSLQLLLITPAILKIIPLLLMLFYILGVICAFQAYKIRGMHAVPNPSIIYKSYLVRSEYDTKKDNFRAMVEAYERNEKEIDKKRRWTSAALISLVLVAILLALPLLFQVIC